MPKIKNHKRCLKCRVLKPYEAFKRNDSARTGRSSWCWDCSDKSRRTPFQLYWSDLLLKSYAVYFQSVRRKYGLRFTQYRRLRELQLDKCGGCGERKKLVVDHCHKTGQVRGLLCGRCNTTLGRLKDNPPEGTGLASYLASSNARAIAIETEKINNNLSLDLA